MPPAEHASLSERDPEGRYRNWRPLGRGGTAMVYKVYDSRLEKDVAIKLLHKDILADLSTRSVMMKSLTSEVNISRELRNKCICPIHDLYEGPEGVGVVMGVVEGGELRGWMNEHANARLATAPERLELLRKLTGALVEAHTLIVHRDLKPTNVILRDGDISQPVIMDFGFAVLGARVDDDSSFAFTPRYAAPEQFEAPETVDRRADLWALGIMAYELFAGRIPPCSLKDVLKTRKAPCVALEHIEPPSLFNAAVPPALDRLILQLMHHDPGRRIQTADDLLTALRGIELLRDSWQGQGAEASDRRAQAVPLGGGGFYIGSRAGARTNRNELPGVRVQLTPFLIDPAPVTNAEYAVFATMTGHALPPLHDQRLPNFGRHPVVGITHAEAAAFARWVGGSLPTEAQWEHAARAGTPFADYPWGNDPPGPTRANIDGVASTTTPVGSFSEGRNAFGLSDMCGNVWEWCLDAYDEGFYRTLPKDTLNPINTRASGDRVLRGGSFQSFAVMGRCAFRIGAAPDERRNDIGFRVVYKADA